MKIKALFLAAVLVLSMLSLAACNGENTVSSADVSSETAVSSVEETVSVESAESKAADKFDEIVDAFSDALEGRTLDKTASCDWNGKFVCADTGAQMTLGQIDNNSFEFTISNGEYELTEKVARVYGNLAVYEQPQTEDETFTLAFCMDGGKIYVALNGVTNGVYYGTYTKA